ncbi:MAG: hypothetical protein RBU37_06555 [Myxococcota bacterium]|nr:hypothetical protein [Myxococcota bacterium]
MSAGRVASWWLLGALVLVVAACDDGNEPVDTVDHSSESDEGPNPLAHCARIGFESVAQITYRDDDEITFYADAFNGDTLSIELYASAIKSAGSYALADRLAESNYRTCTNCVLIAADCNDKGECSKNFFVSKGTLEVSSYADTGRFVGKLSGLELVEVSIDPSTFESKPLESGQIWCIPELSFDSEVQTLTCKTANDCAKNTLTKKCELSAGICLQCLADGDCAGTEYCAFGACLPKCAKDADCPELLPHCDTGTGHCHMCTLPAHCAEFGGLCHPTERFCVSCVSDADCTEEGATHCETESFECVQCLNDGHCDSGQSCNEWNSCE